MQVVGPPGTGKTDVAVQIISNIYHNFPEQRTLLVTHSNQVSPLPDPMYVTLWLPTILCDIKYHFCAVSLGTESTVREDHGAGHR